MMAYYTTMNLPAPSHESFISKYLNFKNSPQKAIIHFENKLKEFFTVNHICTFSNCFTSISLALKFATRNKSKNIAVAALSYRRTTDIVLWAGLKPVYIDNDKLTLAMCLKKLEQNLQTKEIGCVLFQHPMVNIVNPNKVIELCNKYNVPVIFDSVEATGTEYKNKKIGSYGMIEAFSLHPSKIINGAEGGILTFKNENIYDDFCKYMQTIGVFDESFNFGSMYALEPLHAIMGLASLEIYDDITQTHKIHYETYSSRLQKAKNVQVIEYDINNKSNYKSILIKLKRNKGLERDGFIKFLENYNIGARPYYSPLHPFTKNYSVKTAQELSNELLFLPIGHSVNEKIINFICEKILEYEKE
jgi:dTDP-4-amino-4,6-dideoxygalactose transaminase